MSTNLPSDSPWNICDKNSEPSGWALRCWTPTENVFKSFPQASIQVVAYIFETLSSVVSKAISFRKGCANSIIISCERRNMKKEDCAPRSTTNVSPGMVASWTSRAPPEHPNNYVVSSRGRRIERVLACLLKFKLNERAISSLAKLVIDIVHTFRNGLLGNTLTSVIRP